MSRSYEAAICKKLRSLHNTQASIEKTSHALLKNKQFAKEIVKLWYKEFRAAVETQKLAFLHLANDIIQNATESAPQFAKLFEPVLPPAFGETARLPSSAVRSAVAHLLIVWADRQVYPRAFLRQLRSICQHSAAQAPLDSTNGSESSVFNFSFTSALINASAFTCQSRESKKNSDSGINEPTTEPPVIHDHNASTGTTGRQSISAFREELQRELQFEASKAPETGELIKMLESLQSSASGDAATRQKISEFPSEVSNFEAAKNLAGLEPQLTERLREQILNATSQLNAYNQLLEEEMGNRIQLGQSLSAYRKNLQESIKQTKACIEDVKSKCEHTEHLRNSLEVHIRSLPDICLAPDRNTGLDPLPSVSDLFG